MKKLKIRKKKYQPTMCPRCYNKNKIIYGIKNRNGTMHCNGCNYNWRLP